MEAERTFSILMALMTLVIMSGMLLVWYIGGRDVLFGRMTPGELLSFIAYVGMFYGRCSRSRC